MFYSHTFLAKKGPLGTVWCAAHVQHMLKKSHYASTDILSTVDEIMFPKVPIALRMSGHLLLGVVRIYSKKVDYLFQDCNAALVWLRKAFNSVEVNLPEGARKASIESITLPDTFELDGLELDINIYEWGADNHLKNLEDITLTDQIPVGTDPYIAITFDEDTIMEFPHPEQIPGSGAMPMEEDVHQADGNLGRQDHNPTQPAVLDPQTLPGDSNLGFQDPGPSNQTEIPTTLPVDSNVGIQDPGTSGQTEELPTTLPVDSNVGIQDPGTSGQTEVMDTQFHDHNSPLHLPEIEVMRDAVHDFDSVNHPVHPDHGHDTTESTNIFDQIMAEMQSPSPNMEKPSPDLASGEESLPPFQQHSQPPASAVSADGPATFDIHASFGHDLPELAIQPSPPAEQPQARPRRRRLHAFDAKTITLTNGFIKRALEDCSDLLRKRNAPCTALDIWRFKRLRKEQTFDEPLITGMSADLCDISKDLSAAHPHLVEEPLTEPIVAETPTAATEALPQQRVEEASAPANEELQQSNIAHSPPSQTASLQESQIAQSPMQTEAFSGPDVAKSPASMPELDMDIEHLRHDEGPSGSNIMSEFMPSSRRDDWTPLSTNIFGSGIESHVGTSAGTEMIYTPSVGPSTGPHGSELETPMTFSEDRTGAGSTRLSDIPELHSAEAEDLYFLEADSNTPTGSQGTQELDTLSVRTRAVAQYLKRHSPISSISEDLSGDLSLNKILEGKTRKLSARMFYETLVLKSHGLIDVQQEEAYGDITLKLTTLLSKS